MSDQNTYHNYFGEAPKSGLHQVEVGKVMILDEDDKVQVLKVELPHAMVSPLWGKNRGKEIKVMVSQLSPSPGG